MMLPRKRYSTFKSDYPMECQITDAFNYFNVSRNFKKCFNVLSFDQKTTKINRRCFLTLHLN